MAVKAIDIAALVPTDAALPVREGGGGRPASPETMLASEWLEQSHREGDGVNGAGKAITVRQGDAEYILTVLRRAATRLNVGIDTQTVPVKGGKTEVRYATRPKRERKSSQDAAE